MKKFLSVLLVVLIGVCFLSGCGEEEHKKVSFNVGETATFDDVDYTLTKVEKSNGDDFDQPKKGYEYVVVTLKIENKSEENIPYSTFDWKMENSEGQISEESLAIIDSDTALSDGELKPGGSVKGTIVFEEPKKDKGLKLHYYGNILSDEAEFHFVLNGKNK